MLRNIFVVLEGLDGTGKSTVADDLAVALTSAGRPAAAIHTPQGPFRTAATEVNASCDPTTHFLFYLAAVSHTSTLVRDRLLRESVVCDRYIHSTLAYHRARGVAPLVDIDALGLAEPDHTFYLTVTDESVRRRRISERSVPTPGNELIMAEDSLLARIHEEFLRFPLQAIDTTYLARQQVVDEILRRLLP